MPKKLQTSHSAAGCNVRQRTNGWTGDRLRTQLIGEPNYAIDFMAISNRSVVKGHPSHHKSTGSARRIGLRQPPVTLSVYIDHGVGNLRACPACAAHGMRGKADTRSGNVGESTRQSRALLHESVPECPWDVVKCEGVPILWHCRFSRITES